MLLGTFCRKSTKQNQSGYDGKLTGKKSPFFFLHSIKIEGLERTSKEIHEESSLSGLYTHRITLSEKCIFFIGFNRFKSMVCQPCHEEFFRIFHTLCKDKSEFLFIFDFPLQCLNRKNTHEIRIIHNLKNVHLGRDESILFCVFLYFCEIFKRLKEFLSLISRLHNKPLHALKFFTTKKEGIYKRVGWGGRMRHTVTIEKTVQIVYKLILTL